MSVDATTGGGNGVLANRILTVQSPAERLAALKHRPVTHPEAKKPRRVRKAARVVCFMRRHRKRLDLTLEDVSKATGISLMQISGYEVGRIEPRVTAAVKLAAFYGVPVADLWPAKAGA